MIKIEKAEIHGWEAAIRGMRNPMNSWSKRDSEWYINMNPLADKGYEFRIGPNDYDLCKRLIKAGSDHRKFLRMIVVYADITAPLYWWKEYDTYKVGTVANSCSTMHKIHEREFTWDDFSHEKLKGLYLEQLRLTIDCLNNAREEFLDTKDKFYWWQMIQLLPSSYNQKRTLMLNYEVLANIYRSRKNHKLDEWRAFCKWIETLPYAEIIVGEEATHD